MTDQVLDTVQFRGERYDLIDRDGGPVFDPAAHGLQLVARTTACWRGHVCAYAIAADRLELDGLQVTSARAVDRRYEPIAPPPIAGRTALPVPGEPLDAAYQHLALPIAFTGGLLLGTDARADIERRFGRVPWRYARALVLQLAGGAVTGCDDVSELFAAVRARPAARDEVAAMRPGLGWIWRTL